MHKMHGATLLPQKMVPYALRVITKYNGGCAPKVIDSFHRQHIYN